LDEFIFNDIVWVVIFKFLEDEFWKMGVGLSEFL
jgi:hypothetical protein